MIELPFPHKSLWPNGRAHWADKSRETKKHRVWAKMATLADAARPAAPKRLVATFYAKPRGPLPDKDNATAALKAYQDGIADAYGIDDAGFEQPTVIIGERCQNGKVVITLEDATTFRAIGDIIKPIIAGITER